MGALLAPYKSDILDGVKDAIARAEVREVAIPLMPEDLLEEFDLADLGGDPGWRESPGLTVLRTTLFDELGNSLIKSGEAEARMFRYSVREPHEFESPKQPCVSVYLSLVLPSGFKPYVRYEVGPSGGYPS